MAPKSTPNGNLHGKLQTSCGRRSDLASCLHCSAAGCSRAPRSISWDRFFPPGYGCGMLGILLAVVARWFFLRIGLEQTLLLPLVLVYPCLTVFFTFTTLAVVLQLIRKGDAMPENA